MNAGWLRVPRLLLASSAVALAVVATLVAVAGRDTPTPDALSRGSKAIEIVYPIVALTFVAVGLLIARREPGHLVGWLFVLIGLGAETMLLVQGYALYGLLVAPGTVPAAPIALWASGWLWVVPWTLLVIVLLVFPTGRPPSPRWWLVAGLAFGGLIRVVGGEPLPVADADPSALAGAGGDDLGAGLLLVPAPALLAAASLVVRYRRAASVERQQLKWFAYAAAVVAAIFLLGGLFQDTAFSPVVSAVGSFGVLLVPAAAAVAIARYRLYDIDALIDRTLVYGALSAALVATYAAFVILSQAALRTLTGGSELAVAVSTLATLALAQPLRRRIQDAVDRRFYRRRYDAVRVLDAFGERLRDEVDLDAVRADLLDVVGRTVEPVHAGLWLRR